MKKKGGEERDGITVSTREGEKNYGKKQADIRNGEKIERQWRKKGWKEEQSVDNVCS